MDGRFLSVARAHAGVAAALEGLMAIHRARVFALAPIRMAAAGDAVPE